MTELAHVQYTMSVSEVPAYLTNFSNLKNVLHVFQSFCKYEDTNTDISSWLRDSLLATDVMLILEKKIGSLLCLLHNIYVLTLMFGTGRI